MCRHEILVCTTHLRRADNVTLTLVRVLLVQHGNTTLRTEWTGGHRFRYIDGWSYMYTDGQGCPGGGRGGVRSSSCMRVDDRPLREKTHHECEFGRSRHDLLEGGSQHPFVGHLQEPERRAISRLSLTQTTSLFMAKEFAHHDDAHTVL